MSVADVLEFEPSQTLLRSFSNELQKENLGDLAGRGLAVKVAVDRHRERHPTISPDQWDLLLLDARDMALSSVPTEELILLEQSRKLYEAWDKFRKGLPQDQRQSFDGQPPNMRYLFNSVQAASKTWQQDHVGGKSGRLKKIFTDLCRICGDHSNLFSVIPSDDKYICLLTGSLSAIAQASISHQEIAEGVSTSLEELSQDIAFWNRQLSVHGDVKILHYYVKELYVVVFEFLTEIFTNWSKSSFKRFLTSFDEKAVNKLFTEKQRRILAIERRMEREANLEFQRIMKDNIPKMAADQQELHQAVLHGPDRHANMILSLGTTFQRYLEQQTHRSQLQLSQDDTTEPDPQLPGAEIEAPSPLAIEAPEPATTKAPPTALYPELDSQKPSDTCYSYRRDDILTDLRTFSHQVGRDMQEIVQMTFRASYTMVNLQLQSHLLSWTKDTKPNRLWIQGPSGTSQPSQNRLMAVCLSALSLQNDIPCIWYFCSPNHGRAKSKPFYKDALIEMLSSLITQLVLLLPEHFSSSLDLSASRFAVLKSDSPTLGSCLGLLRDLRTLAPPYLHCILDGVHVLEDRSDSQHTQNLLNLIHTLCTLDDEKSSSLVDALPRIRPLTTDDDLTSNENEDLVAQATKICFTTDSYMDGLAQLAALHLVRKVEYSCEAHESFAEDTAGLLPHWSHSME